MGKWLKLKLGVNILMISAVNQSCYFSVELLLSLELNKKEIPVYVKQLGFSIIGQQICGDWDA